MKKLLIIASAVLLVACLPEPNNSPLGSVNLAVAAASPDYATSDVILINTVLEIDEVFGQRIHTTNPADIAIAFEAGELFRLGRYGFDSVSKISIDTESDVVSVDWQRSVLGDDFSANPGDLLALSSRQAYVSRNGSKDLWVVNPAATTDADFLIEKIDLSAFANASSGNPHMADLEWLDGKLFVLLTGLNDSYAAAANSKVVVIDTSTNSLVDTDTSTAGVQAIELPVRNAGSFTMHDGVLYVAATGDAYNVVDTSGKYTGGIATLNATSFVTALLIDDGDLSAAPYGNITGVTVSANNDVYFSGSHNDGVDKLFVQRAGASAISEIDLGANSYNIGDLLATDDALYVGVQAQSDGSENGGLKVIDLDDGTVNRLIELTYNPTQILAL
ncbi:hypothetical protein [Reinekea sp.]|uniref:hypothetical protein n=1 Tax=Reinekea sp. TaxID=1970455 RepID=UPI00257AAC97|nr:hypothetical protein [Reinekea sp.]